MREIPSRRALLPTRPRTMAPNALTSLWAWWDISVLSTLFQDSAGSTPVATNGDPIGYVADRLGSGRYLAQSGAAGTRPTYTTGVQNGLPAALFDGGDYLDSVATIDSFPLTIMGVLRRSATVGATMGIISNFHSTNFGCRVTFNASNQLVARIETPLSTRTSTDAPDVNTPMIFGAYFDVAEFATLTNGAVRSANHAAGAVANIVSLGRTNVNTTATLYNGYLCEVCVFRSALTTMDIVRLTNYFNAKWAVY